MPISSQLRQVRAFRGGSGLFDPLPAYVPTDTQAPPEPSQVAGDTAPASRETSPRNGSIASGEKANARDILAAIRTLKALEKEQRPATAEERQTLARFCGFGPIALSILRGAVTGTYKDAGWQELGRELETLLTPAEYDSAKRTTFNAFYTSPTVITAIHDAVARPGRARDGHDAGTGVRHGQLHELRLAGDTLHRR